MQGAFVPSALPATLNHPNRTALPLKCSWMPYAMSLALVAYQCTDQFKHWWKIRAHTFLFLNKPQVLDAPWTLWNRTTNCTTIYNLIRCTRPSLYSSTAAPHQTDRRESLPQPPLSSQQSYCTSAPWRQARIQASTAPPFLRLYRFWQGARWGCHDRLRRSHFMLVHPCSSASCLHWRETQIGQRHTNKTNEGPPPPKGNTAEIHLSKVAEQNNMCKLNGEQSHPEKYIFFWLTNSFEIKNICMCHSIMSHIIQTRAFSYSVWAICYKVSLGECKSLQSTAVNSTPIPFPVTATINLANTATRKVSQCQNISWR